MATRKLGNERHDNLVESLAMLGGADDATPPLDRGFVVIVHIKFGSDPSAGACQARFRESTSA